MRSHTGENVSNYEVKDSGTRREFGTGAVRDMAEGKGRCDLLPAFAMLEVAKHFEAGAAKYAAENWRKGIPLRAYLDSAIRHLLKFLLGMRDERHDLAAAWNILCLIETQHMIDRGILPATLGDLPDWYDPHVEPDGRVTNAPAYPSDVLVDGISYGGHYAPTVVEDGYHVNGKPLQPIPEPGGTTPFNVEPIESNFTPVELLDKWLTGERFPADPRAPKVVERAALAELAGGCGGATLTNTDRAVMETVESWLILRDGPTPPEDQDVLAAIATAYATDEAQHIPSDSGDDAAEHDDGLGPVATVIRFHDDGTTSTRRVSAREYTRGHAGETAERFNAGLPYADDLRIEELPQPADTDPTLAIAGHPLFDVRIINGDDAKEYDGPEVCHVKDCGCGQAIPRDEPHPMDGPAYVVLTTPTKGDTREWFVTNSNTSVLYRWNDTQPWRESAILNKQKVRDRVTAGTFILKEVGSESC